MIAQRPASGTVLSAKWVFKTKWEAINKFKARLVARGFEQRAGVDYFDTFAPVARMEPMRVSLSIATIKDYSFERFDVSTAFPNGKVDEDIFIEPPEGLLVPKDKCLKLKKALYGLKHLSVGTHVSRTQFVVVSSSYTVIHVYTPTTGQYWLCMWTMG